MFSKPTVFILGAGVSAPFAFPVGRQMKDAICNGAYKTSSGNRIPTLPPNEMAEVIAKAMGQGYAAGFATEFLDAFRASDLYSVDAWLEANQTNPNMLKAGKAAISLVISNAEYIAARNGAEVENDWFAWLWNNMLTARVEEIEKNEVWFITFNYDRLLEWKLDRQVRNTYLRLNEKEYTRAISFLLKRIVHVHGVLGDVPVEYRAQSFGRLGLKNPQALDETSYVHYTEHINFLAQNINIVSETAKDKKLVAEATAITRNKDAKLVFLGFSFDKRNITKLGLDEYSRGVNFFSSRDVDQRMIGSSIIGTAMGIKLGERATIEKMFNGKIALADHDMDAVEFCRSYIRPS